MEGYIPEECVCAEVLKLLWSHKYVSDRSHDLIELSHHAVIKLKTACALSLVNSLVVREVDSDSFAAGIAVTCIVDCIIYIEVRRCTWYECLVLRSTWKGLLELREESNVLSKVCTASLVLEKDECLVCCLSLKEVVIVVLDRSDNKVHVAVLHIHPSEVAGKIVVCTESLYALSKVCTHTLVSSKFCGLLKKCTYSLKLLLVLVAIPNCLKCTILVTTDYCVEAKLVWILKCVPLFHCHILWIVLASEWLLTVSLNERLVVIEVIPRTIVNHCISLLILICKSIHLSFIAESLLPEETIHNLSCLAEKTYDLLVVLRKCIVEWRLNLNYCVALYLLFQSLISLIGACAHC